MNIVSHVSIEEDELLRRLKQVRLKGYERPYVYHKANLELIRQFDPELLTPAQRYVLKDGVQTILDLADAFARVGVDIFNLQGALLFWKEGMNPSFDQPIPFLPPVVEESWEPRLGRSVIIINDGIHRIWAARKRNRRINVVYAGSVPAEYPYYAHALLKGWAEVEEIPELTEGYKKKEYRDPLNYKALFRDFNEVFEGVQKERKKTPPIEFKV